MKDDVEAKTEKKTKRSKNVARNANQMHINCRSVKACSTRILSSINRREILDETRFASTASSRREHFPS